jgi:hypothetical protein
MIASQKDSLPRFELIGFSLVEQPDAILLFMKSGEIHKFFSFWDHQSFEDSYHLLDGSWRALVEASKNKQTVLKSGTEPIETQEKELHMMEEKERREIPVVATQRGLHQPPESPHRGSIKQMHPMKEQKQRQELLEQIRTFPSSKKSLKHVVPHKIIPREEIPTLEEVQKRCAPRPLRSEIKAFSRYGKLRHVTPPTPNKMMLQDTMVEGARSVGKGASIAELEQQLAGLQTSLNRMSLAGAPSVQQATPQETVKEEIYLSLQAGSNVSA